MQRFHRVVLALVLCWSSCLVEGELTPGTALAPWHTYSCGEVTTFNTQPKVAKLGGEVPAAVRNWTRRFCFDEDIAVKKYTAVPRRHVANPDPIFNEPYSDKRGSRVDYIHLTMKLRVTKLVYDGADQPEGDVKPVCGDSLRIIFSSSNALFSPIRLAETACGEHTISFVLPRESESYAVTVRLMHVEKEGLAEPRQPLWPPEADLNKHLSEGPLVYNRDAKVKGLLHAPTGYAFPPLVPYQGKEGAVDERDLTGADLGMGGTAAHPYTQHFGPHTGNQSSMWWIHPGSYHHCRRECAEKEPREWSAACRRLDAQLGHALALPACDNGNHPGRWFKAGQRYPAFEDPWVWQPFSCVYYMYSAQALNSCLKLRQERPGIEAKENDWPQTKFMGESTLGAIYNLWDEKVNTPNYYWDDFADQGELEGQDKARFHAPYHWNGTSNPIALMEVHGLQHFIDEGLGVWLVDETRRKFKAPIGTDALVMLQGANDVQKDTMKNWVARVRKVTRSLMALQDKDQVIRNATTLVWISPPARQYKPDPGNPGYEECDNPEQCWASTHHDYEVSRQRQARGAYWQPSGPYPVRRRLFDTVDRRRLANKIAVKALRSAFPRLRTVDYRALTEPLPPDYSFDGEHYHCTTWWRKERIHDMYQCKNMVNKVLANILANVLCNNLRWDDREPYHQEYPYFLSTRWAATLKKHQERIFRNLEKPWVWAPPPLQDDDEFNLDGPALVEESLKDPRAEEWLFQTPE